MTTLHTRVFLHLPVNDETERRAVRQILGELSRRYRGATVSLLESPVFRGYWEEAGEVVEDAVALILVDVLGQSIDSAAFVTELQELRQFSFLAYAQAGVPQQEIWLVTHPLSRIGD